jgi:hypothetical protein
MMEGRRAVEGDGRGDDCPGTPAELRPWGYDIIEATWRRA